MECFPFDGTSEMLLLGRFIPLGPQKRLSHLGQFFDLLEILLKCEKPSIPPLSLFTPFPLGLCQFPAKGAAVAKEG